MSFQNDLNNLTKVKGVTHKNMGTPPPDTSHLILDSSPSGHSISTNNGIYHSRDQKKFGSSSLYFNGSSYIDIPASSDFNLGTSNFTLDFWVYFNTLQNSTFFSLSDGSASNYIECFFSSISSGLGMASVTSSSIDWYVSQGSPAGWSVDTWYHVAVTRSGSDFKIFRDGEIIATLSDSSGSLTTTSYDLRIGATSYGPTGYIDGYLDEFRFQNGNAEWTTAFDVPTEPHTNDPVPVLLIHSDNMDQLSDYDIWWDADNKDFRIWKDRKWVNDYGYGYKFGGHTGSVVTTTIDKISFPFDSGNSVIIGTMNHSRYATCGCNSSIHGYMITGDSPTLSSIERITFPFNSGISNYVGNLNYSIWGSCSFNSSIHGFSAAGHNTGAHTSTDRILFPFDSGPSVTSGNISIARGYMGTSVNSSQHGFACGGYTNSYPTHTAVDRFTFPFNSGTSSQTGSLGTYSASSSNMNSSISGYVCGGYTTNGSTYHTHIQKLNFPFNSGTASIISSKLNVSISASTGLNSTNYGYMLGGINSGAISIIQRMEFPFDSSTCSVVGNLYSGNIFYPGSVDNTDFVSQFI